MSDPIAEELMRIVRKYADPRNPQTLTLDTPLEETGIDSLGMAEVLFELEDQFQITLPNPGAGGQLGTRSLGDLHAVISGLVASR